MLKYIPVLATCAFLATSHAQTIYKCALDGKLSYSDRPCATGASVELAVPRAPAPDPETAKRLARQRAMVAQMDKRERALEHQQDVADQRARRVANAQKIKCDRLRLRQQWAQEDVRRATKKTSESARIRARRQQQAMALECPS